MEKVPVGLGLQGLDQGPASEKHACRTRPILLVLVFKIGPHVWGKELT